MLILNTDIPIILNSDIPMTMHFLNTFFHNIRTCYSLKNWAGSMKPTPIEFPSSIHGVEHFYSNTFQLLMVNFPESLRQAWSLFSILNEDSRTPPSPGHTAGALLLKSGLSLTNSFAELDTALAWELVFSPTETLCV